MSRLFPTKQEIREFNALARKLYALMGYEARKGFDFSKSKHPQERMCFQMAVASREFWEDLEDDR